VADVIARIVAQKLDERTGWKIIVENRGGAGGNIGAHMVSVAEGDGYTALARCCLLDTARFRQFIGGSLAALRSNCLRWDASEVLFTWRARYQPVHA
jgi:hypothetical protein